MMNSFLNRIAILGLCSVAVAFGAAEEKMEPVLREQWSRLQPDASVSAIIYLTAQADIAGLDIELSRQHVTRALRHEVIIDELRRVAAESQSALLLELSRGKVAGEITGYTEYWIVNAIVVSGKRSAVELIASREDVQYVGENFRAELIEPVHSSHRESLDENEGVPTGIRAIGAPRVWYELGITGAGRLVGTIDTGVRGVHPAFEARWRGRFAPASECWQDVSGESPQFPQDVGFHGTHVTGTLCGNSSITNDSIGVAPGARWIASNAIGPGYQHPVEFHNRVLSAFQWMSDPDSNSNTIEDVPDVVQNSWGVTGGDIYFTDCYQLWNNAIINCEAAGVVVVFSAGNSGPDPQSLLSPATIALDSVTMFSVGAVDANSDTISPFEIADFSSRGPDVCEPGTATKPEVCAPGVRVYSSIPNGYARFDGTSMAGPHVAGIVALMRQANPDADVREIKSVLMRTAVDFGEEGDDNTYGFGFVDAFEAVTQIAANRGVVRGSVTDANSGAPLVHARVSAGDRFTRYTNDAGDYRLAVIGDTTWTVRADAIGYYGQAVPVAVAIGDTVVRDFELLPRPLGTIHGLVLSGADVPVYGAQVTFLSSSLPPVSTGRDGAFTSSLHADTTILIRVTYDDAQLDTAIFLPGGSMLEPTLRLQSARANAQGPDAYGYRAYDQLDLGIPPVYEWVEIAPNRGGHGSILPIENPNASAVIALPFPLFFYGQRYDSITVNENGWIAAGVSNDHAFVNDEIPAAGGPPAMMALYWDDLEMESGTSQICAFYDTVNCRFIVEYAYMRIVPASDLGLNCQLQIFESNSSPTPSLDNEIMFLYERMLEPGGATIGIENPHETIGLQSVYNQDRSDETWVVQASSAILYTTRSEPRRYGDVTGQVIAHPTITNYSASLLTVECTNLRPTTAGVFTFLNLAEGDHAITIALQGYETLTSILRVGPDSTTRHDFEIWRLDPPLELQGWTAEGLVHLAWIAPESVRNGLDELREYLVYRDGESVGLSATELYVEPVPGSEIYRYYVRAVYEGGASDTSNNVLVDGSLGASKKPELLPREFALSAPYPNPFNPTTSFAISLPQVSPVRISAMDILGREVAVISNTVYSAGVHQLHWNAGSLASGLYIIRMEVESHRFLVKALLLK